MHMGNAPRPGISLIGSRMGQGFGGRGHFPPAPDDIAVHVVSDDFDQVGTVYGLQMTCLAGGYEESVSSSPHAHIPIPHPINNPYQSKLPEAIAQIYQFEFTWIYIPFPTKADELEFDYPFSFDHFFPRNFRDCSNFTAKGEISPKEKIESIQTKYL